MDLKQLERLYELKQKGIISDSEFLSEKNKILSTDNDTDYEHYEETPSDISMFNYWASCMSEKYCCFTGEATRKEWWGFTIFNCLLFYPFYFLCLYGLNEILIANILYWIWNIIIFLPMLGLAVRRFHNLKMSGWWLLVWFPIVPIFVLPFLKGTEKDRTSAVVACGFLGTLLISLMLLLVQPIIKQSIELSQNTLANNHQTKSFVAKETLFETETDNKKDTVIETVSILAQQTYNVFADQKSFNQSDDDMGGRYDIGTNIFTNAMDIDLTSPYGGKYSIISFGNAQNSPGFVIIVPNVPYNDCVYFTQKMNWPSAINSRAYPNHSSETKQCTTPTNKVYVFYKK